MNIINKIINKIKGSNKIALFQHINPDGDSISSSYGLALALKEVYPEKEIVVVSDIKYLKTHFPFLDFKVNMFKTEIDKEYLAIIGDTSQKDRILMFDQLENASEIICFDHHKAETDLELSLYWHEPKYPASALQASEIAFAIRDKYNEQTCINLLFGILTDTGFFRYSLTNSKPLQIASQLLDAISDSVLNNVYIGMSKKTKEDIELQSMILSKVQYFERIAYIIFEKSDIDQYGKEAIKSKLYLIANIESCDSWLFLMSDEEVNKGEGYKVSVRSARMDINEVAKKWGGGGHQRASGCFVQSKKDIPLILKDLNQAKSIY